MRSIFTRSLLLSALLLTQADLAHSYPYVCTPGLKALPSTQDPAIQQIIQAIDQVAGGPLVNSMATSRGHTFEYCWMLKEGQAHPAFQKGVGTSFWNATASDGTKASGIVYTVEMLNLVLSVAKRPVDAVLPALFVIYHEIGHALVYFGQQTGELANTIRDQNELFLWMRPIASKYRGMETAMLASLTGNTWGSETFADCYGSYLMGIAMLAEANPGKAQTFYERLTRQKFNEANFKTSMNVAASISSQLLGQDEHGTATERQSFVAYGVSLASHYLTLMKLNPLKAGNTAMLACADMAYEQSQQKLKLKQKWGITLEVPGRVFDAAAGF